MDGVKPFHMFEVRKGKYNLPTLHDSLLTPLTRMDTLLLQPDAYAAYLYDATMVWAITVNKILEENKDPSHGSLLFKTALKIVYPEGKLV
jgi:hypothetical protein